jgi:hypothetical protein
MEGLARVFKVGDLAGHVHVIDPLSDPRWAALVENHPRASVFHSTSWLKALLAVYGYEPLAVTTCFPGHPLTNGLVFCHIRSRLTGQRYVSLPFSDHCAPLTDTSEELDEMLLSMKAHVDEDGLKYLEIRPYWCEPSSRTKLGKSLTYRSHRLDLRRSKEEIFRRFHKDCVQRKIRRAEREKLRYEQGVSELLLREFYRLLVMTRRRQGLPPQPLAWFRGLITAFRSNLQVRVAYKDNLPVASILTLSHKRSMVYKYGCSDVRFHRLGGMQLLLWNTIQEAKDNGCEELDLGRSNIDNSGLIVFKRRWGGTESDLSYWTYPVDARTQSMTWQRGLLRGVVSLSPNVALTAAGNLLYRHIG